MEKGGSFFFMFVPNVIPYVYCCSTWYTRGEGNQLLKQAYITGGEGNLLVNQAYTHKSEGSLLIDQAHVAE